MTSTEPTGAPWRESTTWRRWPSTRTRIAAPWANWREASPAVKPIEINQVVVVRNGTQSGRPTVDIVLQDETGQRFVCMVTGALLKSIPC
jgi:hypothetical protein